MKLTSRLMLRWAACAAVGGWVGAFATTAPALAADDVAPLAGSEGSDGVAAAAEPAAVNDFADLSLEDLMNVEVTSVSKQRQRVADAAAAVYVISSEDIRRSGLSSIPELLRMVPGLQVAQFSASQWAISSRGFNDLFGNKLLVVMDGRTVYTPAFSGVYWDSQDTVLADIDRIEVIRGPGATLWGSNAVNGVINITTKSSRDTQGWLLNARGGNAEQVLALRYGGKLAEDTYYRAFGKFRNVDSFPDAGGDQHADDQWEVLRGGLRIDHYAGPDDTVTLQADAYGGPQQLRTVSNTLAPPYTVTEEDEGRIAGGSFLARWEHVGSPDSDFALQFYYDRVSRSELGADYDQDTFDLDFQHRVRLDDRNEVIYGGNARYLRDHLSGTGRDLTVDPEHHDDYILSVFVQDDITVVKDRFHVYLGTKLEHNSYSGFEVQPGIRAAWTPDARNTVWGSVARAVRTPSRVDEDMTISAATFPTGPGPADPTGEVEVRATGRLQSEELTAFELGYRVQPTERVTVDVAGFVNVYNRLRDNGPTGAPVFVAAPTPHVVLPVNFENGMDGFTYGAEVAANWNVTDNWRLSGSYSWLVLELESEADAAGEAFAEGASPEHQFQLHSRWNVTKNVELNASAYYVDHLYGADDIPSYVRVDAAITWRPKDGLELSAGIQNLLDDKHPEFGDDRSGTASSEVPRTVYGQLTYRF